MTDDKHARAMPTLGARCGVCLTLIIGIHRRLVSNVSPSTYVLVYDKLYLYQTKIAMSMSASECPVLDQKRVPKRYKRCSCSFALISRIVINNNNNNNTLIYIAPACRMTSEALADSSSRATECLTEK